MDTLFWNGLLLHIHKTTIYTVTISRFSYWSRDPRELTSMTLSVEIVIMYFPTFTYMEIVAFVTFWLKSSVLFLWSRFWRSNVFTFPVFWFFHGDFFSLVSSSDFHLLSLTLGVSAFFTRVPWWIHWVAKLKARNLSISKVVILEEVHALEFEELFPKCTSWPFCTQV